MCGIMLNFYLIFFVFFNKSMNQNILFFHFWSWDLNNLGVVAQNILKYILDSENVE